MIIILHGEDTTASRARLRQIQNSAKGAQTIFLGAGTTQEEFYKHLLTNSFFEEEKLIVFEDYILGQKKFSTKILEDIPKNKIVIFYERAQLAPSKIAKVAKIAKIENFKPQGTLFPFLDSLYPKSKTAQILLWQLKDQRGILWHLQNRLFLMILAARGLTLGKAQQISGRKLADWQWARIKNQAAKFSLVSLLGLFSAALKVDQMIKKGQTDLDENALTSFLLLKYL